MFSFAGWLLLLSRDEVHSSKYTWKPVPQILCLIIMNKKGVSEQVKAKYPSTPPPFSTGLSILQLSPSTVFCFPTLRPEMAK